MAEELQGCIDKMHCLRGVFTEDRRVETDTCVIVYELGVTFLLGDEAHRDKTETGEALYGGPLEENGMPHGDMSRQLLTEKGVTTEVQPMADISPHTSQVGGGIPELVPQWNIITKHIWHGIRILFASPEAACGVSRGRAGDPCLCIFRR